MLRPTMSHAVSAERLAELKDEYITHLEEKVRGLKQEVVDLKVDTAVIRKNAKVEVLSSLENTFGLDSNHGLYPDDIADAIALVNEQYEQSK
jgi:ribosomal protein L29